MDEKAAGRSWEGDGKLVWMRMRGWWAGVGKSHEELSGVPSQSRPSPPRCPLSTTPISTCIGYCSADVYLQARGRSGQLLHDYHFGVHSSPVAHIVLPVTPLLPSTPPCRYIGNWSAASYLRWGRRAGCTFATRTCTAIGAPYFCPLAPKQATSLDTAPLNSTLYSSGLGLAPSNASERQLPQQQEQPQLLQQQPQQSQQQPQQLPQQPQQPPQQLQQGALDVCTFDGMSRANCNQTVFSDCPMLRTPESMREPAVRRCSCTHPAAYFNSDSECPYVGRGAPLEAARGEGCIH